MAIKTVSLLEEFDNGIDPAMVQVGGSLTEYNSKNITVNDKECKQAPTHSLTLEYNSGTYNQTLFEMSVPRKAGSEGVPVLNDEYYSKKITYENLVRNIILDTKAYLNTRNNLGEFNLCAIVFDDYTYTGHKYFLPSEDTHFGAGVDIKRSVSDGYALSVNGKTNLSGDVDIYGNTIIGKSSDKKYLKVYGGITGYSDFVVDGILTANNTKVDITKQLSVGNHLYVYQSAIFHDNVTIEKNLSVLTGDLKGKNGYFSNDLSCKKLTASIELTCPTINSTTINAKDGTFSGDLKCNGLTCSGGTAILTAAHALWSDLAEYYLADGIYEPGTLIEFGGKNEVTIATNEVNAIVTSRPAYIMNGNLKDNKLGCPLALVGRIPVKVIGKVKKFDKITLSYIPGIACVKNNEQQRVIGRALENNFNEEIKLVECVVKFDM